MKTLFYPKLAVNGMKKNKRLYLPYILTLVAMVMMMYITAYLARSENIANTNRAPAPIIRKCRSVCSDK